MGVPKEVFVNLELKMILQLLDTLINEKEAACLLAQNLPVFPFNELKEAGVALTGDPFFRCLLLAHFKFFAGIVIIFHFSYFFFFYY